MLDFVIFAVTFAVALIAAIIYLYPGARRVTTIPGLDPSDTKDGNLSDIMAAGGLHPFLMDVHEKFGAIAGFWCGEQYVVSIASPELFKEQMKIFDRPRVLQQCFEPILGSSSIFLTNGLIGRRRHKSYISYFDRLSGSNNYKTILQIGENMVEKWASLPEKEHIPLYQYMIALTFKSILISIFGSSINDKSIIQFRKLLEVVWSELSSRFLGNSLSSENSHDKIILKNIDEIRSILRNVINERKLMKDCEVKTFLDCLLEDSEMNDEERLNDCLTLLIGGFHTGGNLMTWAIYFLALNQEIQEKFFQELRMIAVNEKLEEKNLNDLKFIRHVIDETIRYSALAPVASRYQDIDVEIGGHIIPKGTPIIHALGVVQNDRKIWTLPDEFNPDRFEEKLQSLQFNPFGFAGQRICPGRKFVYFEATIFLAIFLKRFKIDLVEGQLVNPVFGLVTRPEEEIWITITERNK